MDGILLVLVHIEGGLFPFVFLLYVCMIDNSIFSPEDWRYS